jgi:AraC-like DNA-binding protein
MNKATPELKDLQFHNPRLSKVGVEALTLDELRHRADAELLLSPQRVDFLHLLLVQEGRAKHMVDFVEHELKPGSVMLVRPGQVQQWRMRAQLQGQLALISSEALSPTLGRAEVDMRLLALPQWPAVSRPSQGLFMEAMADISRLAADVARFEGTDFEAAIIRHEVLTLLLRLARELRSADQARQSTREAEIHALFAKALEASYTQRLSVLDYAKRLGFSESTLSRACVATVGRTAKNEIDGRVALEAKRLLVHSQATALQIGHQLGFTEPTNFVKFFRRNCGCTPLEFREAHR